MRARDARVLDAPRRLRALRGSLEALADDKRGDVVVDVLVLALPALLVRPVDCPMPDLPVAGSVSSEWATLNFTACAMERTWGSDVTMTTSLPSSCARA